VARAIENQAWVVGVNRAGADPNATYAGRSLVVDPTGVVRADLGEGERWLQLDVDMGEAARWRAEFPALRDPICFAITFRPAELARLSALLAAPPPSLNGYP